MPQKEMRGSVFAFPLLGIVALLTFYLLLADWQYLPLVIGSALAALHFGH
jgi:hypothetical protein